MGLYDIVYNLKPSEDLAKYLQMKRKLEELGATINAEFAKEPRIRVSMSHDLLNRVKSIDGIVSVELSFMKNTDQVEIVKTTGYI